MKILITGRPGTGKSTVIGSVVETFRQKGLKVGGIVCPDLKEKGVRIGFEMIDLITGRRGILASIGPLGGPVVGKYSVNMPEIEAIGVAAIRRAMTEADLIIIDEIGPMEMKSKTFEKVIKEAMAGSKNILAAVHWSLADQMHMQTTGSLLLEVNLENRDLLVNKIIELFSGGGSNQ